MKRVVIRSTRPETSHLLAAMVARLFPECEICIVDHGGLGFNPSWNSAAAENVYGTRFLDGNGKKSKGA